MGCSLLALGSSLSHLLNSFQRECSKCSILLSVLILFMTFIHALPFFRFFSCCWAWTVQGNLTPHSTLLMLSPHTHGFPWDSQNPLCPSLRPESGNNEPDASDDSKASVVRNTEELCSVSTLRSFPCADLTSPDSFVSLDAATSEGSQKAFQKYQKQKSFP